MLRPAKTALASRSTAALFLGVLFGASLCHAWSSAHGKITKAALGALPDWQREHWRESETAFGKYCIYVDMGLENAEAKPYLVVVQGRLFHYFPRENREDYTMFMEGAERYVRLIVGKMHSGDYGEAAKFAGGLAHTLEDLGQPQCHALEGVNGIPWTTLDELFTPEDQTWNRAPQSIISMDDDPRFVVRIEGYRPQLLGTHPKEVAFRLYQRSCRMRQFARKALPAMLTRVYAGDHAGAVDATLPSAVEDAKLVADMFYTCFALAAQRFEPEEVKALEALDLTSVVPIAAPALINRPYRFSPLAYGCSVNTRREPVPLQLWQQDADGQKREVVLKRGIGTGCCRFSYEIPSGVFREFRCLAGLHAQLGQNPAGASLRLAVRFAGKEVFNSGVLTAGSTAQSVVVPVASGGTLEFISEGQKDPTANDANQTVWGEPVLVRLEKTEEPTAAPAAAPAPAAAVEAPPAAATIKAPARVPGTPPAASLLPNGSFEDWGADGLPVSWKTITRQGATGVIVKETADVRSGAAAACYAVDADDSVAALYCGFRNEPGKRYRLTFCWKSPVGGIQYAIKRSVPGRGWIAFNGRDWQTGNANPQVQGDKDTWNQTTVEFPAFGEAMDLNVEICRPGGRGKAYSFLVDEVTLEEITAR